LGFYERGENQPPFDVAVKIANALEISVTKLVDNPYDIFKTPEFVIDEWLYSHGYKTEYDMDEGGIYLVDTSNNTTYELQVGQLKHLEKSISDYTKFQVQELLKNCRSLPLKQEGSYGAPEDIRGRKMFVSVHNELLWVSHLLRRFPFRKPDFVFGSKLRALERFGGATDYHAADDGIHLVLWHFVKVDLDAFQRLP